MMKQKGGGLNGRVVGPNIGSTIRVTASKKKLGKGKFRPKKTQGQGPHFINTPLTGEKK